MPLSDVRVLELATVIAGPGCGRYLADFGADVIKIERKGSGDSIRSLGWRHPDGDTLWWKFEGRNKRSIALDLKDPDDVDLVLRLVETADVLIENLRPGKLAALGLGPEILHARNPNLVITRVTGFGQDGPDADRAAFATLAEAMSGFAAINGSADSGPTLPPIALTDEVAGLAAAFATMVALHSGQGQIVDVSLREAMLQIMGPLASLASLTGEALPQMGSQLAYTAPRNTYRCRDGRWVAISTSSESVARRVMELLGLGGDPRVATNADRVEHRGLVDGAVAAWVGARTYDEVQAAFDDADAACAEVLDMVDIVAEPHLLNSNALIEVGGLLMQGLVARLSATPGSVRHPAPTLDQHGAEIRAEADSRRP